LTAAAVAWGLLDCFFGYRIFKVTVTFWGIVVGAIFGKAAGEALGMGLPGEIGGMAVGTLLGGGLAFMLYLAAVFLAGFLFGVTLGMLLLANYNPNVALMGGCVVGIVSGIAALYLQKLVLILATALVGAFWTLVAAMYFTQHLDWLFYVQEPRQIPALIEGNSWLLPGVLVLAAIGAIAQFELRGLGSGKKTSSGKK
jgi:hypothetical protein